MGNTESNVRNYVKNKYGTEIAQKIENNINQSCGAEMDLSNTLILKGLKNVKDSKFKQTSKGQNTCKMNAGIDALQKADLDASVVNDIISKATSEGNIFPAETNVDQTIINEFETKLSAETINNSRAECLKNVLMGSNRIMGEDWEDVSGLEIEQTSDLYNSCIMSANLKAAQEQGVEISAETKSAVDAKAKGGGILDAIFGNLFGGIGQYIIWGILGLIFLGVIGVGIYFLMNRGSTAEVAAPIAAAAVAAPVAAAATTAIAPPTQAPVEYIQEPSAPPMES